MRIIKIRSCDECPYSIPISPSSLYCKKKRNGISAKYRLDREVPDWCPLRKENKYE